MIAEQINNFFLKQVVVILLLIVFASVTYAEDSLQEQEFQTIETEKIQIENEKDFSYVISSLPTQINTSSNFVLYNLKNEYYESIKVILEASFSDTGKTEQSEFYLNAYESKKDIPLASNAKIKVKVYNLYDQYLGFISFEKKDPNIKVSPFLLIPAEFDQKNKKLVSTIKEVQKAVDKPVFKDEIKDGVGLIISKSNPVSVTTQITETKSFNGKPEPIIRTTVPTETTNFNSSSDPKNNLTQTPFDTNPKKIKIANISDSDIHVIIKKPSGEVYGDSWTVSNDVYVPQFLNLQSEPIIIDTDSIIIITNTKTSKTLIKKANELNIDERGNYVWFVEDFSASSKTPETTNVIR
jgi:hypothetical protein